MVNHQKRNHSSYGHSLDHDNCPSESDGSGTQSPTPDSHMQFNDPVGQNNFQFNDMQIPASMNFNPHLNIHPSQYNHPHNISGQIPHGFPGQTVHHQQQHHHHHQPSIVIQGPISIPMCPFYETDQNNPGVATMNTSMIAPYTIPRQQPGQIRLEIPPTAARMTDSTQTTPIQYSPASAHSPSVHRMYQPPTYPIPPTPVEQQPLMQYTYRNESIETTPHPAEAITPHQPLSTATPHPLPTTTPHTLSVDVSLQAISQVPEQNHSGASPSDGDWHSPPCEVSYEEPPILAPQYYLLPGINWDDDKDYNDPSMPMPSERFNNM